MDRSKFVKLIYSGVYIGNRPSGRQKERWIESGKECLIEQYVNFPEARRVVHNNTEWRGFGWEPSPKGMDLTMTRYQ